MQGGQNAKAAYIPCMFFAKSESFPMRTIMYTKISNLRLVNRSFYLVGILALCSAFTVAAKDYTLLNVSYDVSRELYKDINTAFADSFLKQTGDQVTIQQSHDGSTKQAASAAGEGATAALMIRQYLQENG